VELIPRPYAHPDVVTLTDEVQAHYRELYGGPGDQSLVEVADFEPPTGHFVVGYLDGIPVAMGGWRRLGDRPGLPSPHTAEILDWLVLETGRPQASAVSLYRASGYTDVDGTPYGHYVGYPDSIHLGKSLG